MLCFVNTQIDLFRSFFSMGVFSFTPEKTLFFCIFTAVPSIYLVRMSSLQSTSQGGSSANRNFYYSWLFTEELINIENDDGTILANVARLSITEASILQSSIKSDSHSLNVFKDPFVAHIKLPQPPRSVKILQKGFKPPGAACNVSGGRNWCFVYLAYDPQNAEKAMLHVADVGCAILEQGYFHANFDTPKGTIVARILDSKVAQERAGPRASGIGTWGPFTDNINLHIRTSTQLGRAPAMPLFVCFVVCFCVD